MCAHFIGSGGPGRLALRIRWVRVRALKKTSPTHHYCSQTQGDVEYPQVVVVVSKEHKHT